MICGQCCLQEPYRCLGSGLWPVAVLVSEDYTTAGGLWISVPCIATQAHDIFWAWTAAEGHVWVRVSVATGVCVDIHVPCYCSES